MDTMLDVATVDGQSCAPFSLSVPTDPNCARIVRMTASAVAAHYGLTLDEIEDVRMIAEEAFIYACASGIPSCELTMCCFKPTEDTERATASRCFELSVLIDNGGEQSESGSADEMLEYAELLLRALCDEICVEQLSGEAFIEAKGVGTSSTRASATDDCCYLKLIKMIGGIDA